MAVTGLTIHHVGERFQRSNETISKYFKRMLYIFSSPPFYNRWVRLPGVDEPVDPQISKSAKLHFFKGALGAIDGSHIHLFAPAAQRGPFRNRK
ncbi:hypothetical protein FIBSPDRAFT_667502, partial [Athelia psychrophila]